MPNISRSKRNQAMKFCQFIEYDMRYIFLEKSYSKCGGKTSPDPFLKNLNWAYFSISSLNICTVCAIVHLGFEDYRNTLKLKCWPPLLLPHIKIFKKAKRGPGLASLPHSLHDFWRKIFLVQYSINWQSFIVLLSYSFRYWAICVL